MSEGRFVPHGFREDFFAEAAATIIALAACAVLYSFVGHLLRLSLDIPYWDLGTPFVVFSQFIQNSVLGIVSSLCVGCVIAVYVLAKLVVYLLVEDYEDVPA